MTENIVLCKWKCFVRGDVRILRVSEQLFLTFSFETFSFHPNNVKIIHSGITKIFLLVYYTVMFCHYEIYWNGS